MKAAPSVVVFLVALLPRDSLGRRSDGPSMEASMKASMLGLDGNDEDVQKSTEGEGVQHGMQTRITDPMFAGVTVGISVLAKATNAAVTGLRLWQSKNAFEVTEAAARSISEHKRDTCFLMRTFQMEAVLANGLVSGFVRAGVHTSTPANTGLRVHLDNHALEAVDRVAREGLNKLNNDTTAIANGLEGPIDRLVQTACHQISTNEYVLYEDVADIRKRVADLEKQLLGDSISVFAEIGSAFGAIKDFAGILSGATGSATVGSNSTTSVAQLKARWDTEVDLLLKGLDGLAARDVVWKHVQGTLHLLLGGLGGLGAYFVGATVWLEGEESNALVIFNNALILITELVQLTQSGAKPSLSKFLSTFSAALSLAMEVTGFAGVSALPGVSYAHISIKTFSGILTLTENSIAYAEEGREFALSSAQAQSTVVGQGLSFSRSTCLGLHQAYSMALEEQQLIARLASTVTSDDPTYDSAEVEASFDFFCFKYPSLCNQLSGALLADAAMSASVSRHASTLLYLAEAAPISDFASETRTIQRRTYANMGFKPLQGLRSVMVCRGCGMGVVFNVVLLDTSTKLHAVQQAFAQGNDSTGSDLPEYATLNIFTYSSSHHALAFYKAPISSVVAQARQAQLLISLQSIALRLDNASDADADAWQARCRTLLEQAGGQVMAWERGGKSRWFPEALGGDLANGNKAKASHYDSYTALVATYAPSAMFPGGGTDWRYVVPPSINVELKFVSALKGCGCQLLFHSQYTTFLPSWPYESLRNVRVQPLWLPDNQEQSSRCDYSVGLWLSSQPLALPSEVSSGVYSSACQVVTPESLLSEPVRSSAELTVDEELAGACRSGTRFLRSRGCWNLNAQPGLTAIDVPGVLDSDGFSFTNRYHLFHASAAASATSVLEASALDRAVVKKDATSPPTTRPTPQPTSRPTPQPAPPTSRPTQGGTKNQGDLAELRRGGPVRMLVEGIRGVLCDAGDVAACSFADEPLQGSVETALSVIEGGVTPTVPSDKDFATRGNGSSRIEFKQIPTWSRCKQSAVSNSIAQIFSQISGVIRANHVPVLAGSAPLPALLESLAENSYRDGCDFLWWTTFDVCDGGQAGYVSTDTTSGILNVECGTPTIQSNTSLLGPVRKLFLRVSLDTGSDGNWKHWDSAADAIATRDGFVQVNPSGVSSYQSPKSWEGGFCCFVSRRHLRIGAYVQLDPRISVTRDATCASVSSTGAN
jgi:hypothetical protein